MATPKIERPGYQVRQVERGYWTFDLYIPGRVPHFSVGEIHGDERKARRSARASLLAELAKQ